MSQFRVQTEDKQKALAYFDSVAKSYDEVVGKGLLQSFRDRERHAVLEFAALEKGVGLSMVDVGCGAGFYALIAKKNGFWVAAGDASAPMVERLKGKVDLADVIDIENFDLNKKFDRVVCAGVMDFVTSPEKAFLNLCKHVAPGGRLVVLAPRRGPGGLFYRVEKFFFGFRINLYDRKWFITRAEAQGLRFVDYRHPLPTNMALLFQRDKSNPTT